MNKKIKAVLDSIEDAGFATSPVKVDSCKTENKNFYIDYKEEYYILLWGTTEVARVLATTRATIIAMMFYQYIIG